MEKLTAREIMEVYEFKGECANEYKTRYDYVISGAFEKDYFSSWLDSCSDYPMLNEIIEFCQTASKLVDKWIHAVDEGVLDSEGNWG